MAVGAEAAVFPRCNSLPKRPRPGPGHGLDHQNLHSPSAKHQSTPPRHSPGHIKTTERSALPPICSGITSLEIVPGSSVVERTAVNRQAGGSNPSWGAIRPGGGVDTQGEMHHPSVLVQIQGRASNFSRHSWRIWTVKFSDPWAISPELRGRRRGEASWRAPGRQTLRRASNSLWRAQISNRRQLGPTLDPRLEKLRRCAAEEVDD
jgi:hypothetical protein